MAITLKTISKRIADAFSTVRWKTIIIYFSIFVFVFGFIAATVGNIVSDFLSTERTNSQQEINQQFSMTVVPHVLSNNSNALYDACLNAGNTYSGRFIVTDANKIVIADSFSELNGTKLSGKEVGAVADNGADKAYEFYKSRSGETTLHSVNYACGIYGNSGELVGVCVYVASFQDIRQKINEIYVSIWTIAVLASVAVFILCLVSSHYITKPLQKFSTAISNISGGNFDTQIEVHGKSELDELGRTFNMMSKKLANLDRLRNEFVSNASHELRTPLSSIKILIQSMMYDEEMSDEVRMEFLKDIDAEIDRLNNIIEDLLNLVQTNNTKNSLRLSQNNIKEMLEETIEKLKPIAEKKNIDLQLYADDVIMNCDKIKLQICFSNLIDNAIKYGNENGHVYIDCHNEANNLVVTVKDDGIGIPEHDLPNIFDRFYRVDKTRSRSTGGTGLGLSITQRVVHMHGGTISTTSKLGEGTEFTVTIPIVE